ncbi:MAG: 4-alpha-glucanotransferase [Steroidobacteraceae bacterium]
MLDSLIDRLASQRGIGDAYHNYRGDLVHVSRASKQAILAAMGCPVDDPDAIERALQAHEAARWTSLLEPVAVVHPARPAVAVAIAAAALDQEITYALQLEDGSAREGRVRAGDLRETERAEIDGRWRTRRELPMPTDLPHGYHTLRIALGAVEAACALIVAPGKCFEPAVLHDGRRLWGVAVQLYTLRSPRNWGIGDFADLDDVVRTVGAAGGAFVGLNPLHALFPANPWHFSPYSASSRHFLNVLYVAVERVPGFDECAEAREAVAAPGFQAELERLRGTANVDYPGVARAKLRILELLHAHFTQTQAASNTGSSRAFAAFKAERGDTLRLQALYDAIDEQMRSRGDRYWGWPVWPEPLRHPDGADVMEFARRHASRVDFYEWLQWLADAQLSAVQRRGRELGMPIGLYGDYAVGVIPSGAETWADQALYRKAAGVGAPPDALALKGQDWGIPPQDPNVLKAERYQPFRRLLAASMRSFGALRLDHVMALYRQWWVPVGLEPTQGGYVHYPVDDLMSVLALESERHQCLVVGEDLGTVPPEMTRLMTERAVYSYRVLLFEKHGDGRFREPGEYPRRAIATVTTHDLPTLKGYWAGSDVDLRERLALYPDAPTCARVRQERQYDRESLTWSLGQQGLEPVGHDAEAGFSAGLAHAVHVFLGRSASALVVLQAEDLAGMADPVNVPGTCDEHPNWQRKMTTDLCAVLAQPHNRELLRQVAAARSAV